MCSVSPMQKIELRAVDHEHKIGQRPVEMPPTFSGDAIFYDDDEPIGFYIATIPEKLKKLTDVADYELNSKRVPKSEMRRAGGLHNAEKEVKQFSTIIGSVPPKEIMRRPYPTRSSVHAVDSAQPFIKAMTLAGREALKIIESVDAGLYERHKAAVESAVPQKWRFCDLFTSSISNFNIAAPIHRDALNVKGALNAIITKRKNSTGGNLFIPDYNITINSAHDSLLVYPAWRNSHGVTPIVPTHEGGYRNSLIWYALDAFKDYGRDQ